MKKLLFGALALGMITACTNDNAVTQSEDFAASASDAVGRRACPSDELRQEALKSDPVLKAKFDALET